MIAYFWGGGVKLGKGGVEREVGCYLRGGVRLEWMIGEMMLGLKLVLNKGNN